MAIFCRFIWSMRAWYFSDDMNTPVWSRDEASSAESDEISSSYSWNNQQLIEIFPTTVWTHVSRILRSIINKSDLHRDQFYITGKCITTMYLLKLVYCIKPNFLTWTVSSGDDFIEEDISCYCHQTRVITKNRFWLSWLENIEHINNCSREESVLVDIELIDSNGISTFIWRMTKLILAPFKMFRTFLIQTIGPNHSLTVF